jgi:predicted TIM-barrel fold metal-dependent hydrolase
VLSLPDRRRINFNPEVLYAKARLGARCYGLAAFDYGELLRRPPPQAVPPGAGPRAASPRAASPRAVPPGPMPPASVPSADGAEMPDLGRQVERYHALGFDGLKIFLGKPTFQRELGLKLSNPPLLAALKRAESLGLPALIHIADPPVFWSPRDPSGFVPPGWDRALEAGVLPSYQELQRQARQLLRACPDLKVVFPHLMSMAQDLSGLAEILENHPGVYLDLAPGLYFFYELDRQRRAAREFFSRYRERLLFGSDAFLFPEWFSEFPYATVEDNLQRARRLLGFLEGEAELDNPFEPTRRLKGRLRGLGLERDILSKILRSNFLGLYGESSRPVGGPACLEYLDGFLEGLAAHGAARTMVKEVEDLRRETKSLLSGRVE